MLWMTLAGPAIADWSASSRPKPGRQARQQQRALLKKNCGPRPTLTSTQRDAIVAVLVGGVLVSTW
jgi:hypothetical protein